MRGILRMVMAVALVGGMTGVSFAGTGAPSKGTPSPSASGCPVCSKTTSDNYLVKTGSTLTRGVANAGLCWVELGNQPMKEVKNGGNVLVGIGKGIGHTGLRFVEGAGEVLTAPMPKAKDGSQIAHDCPLDVLGVTT